MVSRHNTLFINTKEVCLANNFHTGSISIETTYYNKYCFVLVLNLTVK